MSLDLTLLRLLSKRSRFDKLIGAVPKEALDIGTATLIDDFRRYYKEFPDIAAIPSVEFRNWFRLIHPKLEPDKLAVFDTLLRKVFEQEPDQGLLEGMTARLIATSYAHKMAELLGRWDEGAEVDLFVEAQSLVQSFEQDLNRKVKTPLVADDIEAMLEEDKNDTGLHWRLDCLNSSMRPLRGGDFGIIAARPDKGKTSFLTSELTFMAPQVDAIYPDENRSILWLNNEGPGNRIVKRTYQSAFGETISELVARRDRGTLREDYASVLGRAGIIKVFDIHDFWNYEVEDLIRQYNPAVVVFDMVDNIKFGGLAANNGQRTDQLLEAMYQWARILAVKYDCVTLATSQISADGDGLAYPTLSMLKDSKTGKQGAAEFIITLGALNDEYAVNSRFIGCTKNKLAREGQPKSPRCEVIFSGDTGRFHMPEL